MTGMINLMGDVARDQEHLDIPGYCDVINHAESDE
jgi:hypothetical protein